MPDSFDDADSGVADGYRHAQTRRPGDRLRALVVASRNMVVSLAGDVGLPIVAYAMAELCGFSTYVSLLAGTVVAAIRMAWVAAAKRFAGAAGSEGFLATADTAVNVAQVLTVVAYGLLRWTVLTAKQQSRKPRLVS